MKHLVDAADVSEIRERPATGLVPLSFAANWRKTARSRS
jgi:hypothetical protein